LPGATGRHNRKPK